MVGVLLGRSFDMSAEDSLLFTASVRSCSQPCLIFLGQSAAMLGFVQFLLVTALCRRLPHVVDEGLIKETTRDASPGKT